jgi:hypothetical protein
MDRGKWEIRGEVRKWTDVPLQRGSECRAIGDGGMNSRCRWWTPGVALIRLWDSGCGRMRKK